eukprot:46564-Eustigmatos_ZCMA.PRE.1
MKKKVATTYCVRLWFLRLRSRGLSHAHAGCEGEGRAPCSHDCGAGPDEAVMAYKLTHPHTRARTATQ